MQIRKFSMGENGGTGGNLHLYSISQHTAKF